MQKRLLNNNNDVDRQIAPFSTRAFFLIGFSNVGFVDGDSRRLIFWIVMLSLAIARADGSIAGVILARCCLLFVRDSYHARRLWQPQRIRRKIGCRFFLEEPWFQISYRIESLFTNNVTATKDKRTFRELTVLIIKIWKYLTMMINEWDDISVLTWLFTIENSQNFIPRKGKPLSWPRWNIVAKGFTIIHVHIEHMY